ncbi:hypothetical protein D3C84_1066100 [compost metagenome]
MLARLLFFWPALRVQVLEHQEFAKREEPQGHLIGHDLPALLLADHIANIGKERTQGFAFGSICHLGQTASRHIQAKISFKLGHQ